MAGVLIVVGSVAVALLVGLDQGLDGLQTTLVGFLAWAVLTSAYHGVLSTAQLLGLAPRRRGRR
jgi:hypothetical protein